MRVLTVTPRFAPEIGGVERHVQEVTRRLALRGCAMTVLTTDRSGALPERETIDGVDVRRVAAYPRGGDLHLAPRLGRAMEEERWDVVHVQSYHTLVAPHAMAAAARRRLPYVVTFHGGGHSSRVRNAIRRPQRLALRPLLARARRLVAVADFEVDLYGRELELPRERFTVIPNGADLPRPVPFRDAGGSGVLIVSVGRLERYKGHHRVIEALPAIVRAEPQARLWIAGSGPYGDRLTRLAARTGVADRVEIRAVPADERERWADELARASVVVLMSEFETHPIAALEARALGRPLVVADSPGLRAFADGEARAVAADASPAEVAQAVLGALRAPPAPPAAPPPTWDDCASALLDLYREVACAS